MSDSDFDPGPFIRSAKLALRENNDTAKQFQIVADTIRAAVDDVVDKQANTGAVVPELSFEAIKDNKVSTKDIASIRQCGCVIIRGVFPHAMAEDWNQELGDYLDSNNYLKHAKEKAGLIPTLAIWLMQSHRSTASIGLAHKSWPVRLNPWLPPNDS